MKLRDLRLRWKRRFAKSATTTQDDICGELIARCPCGTFNGCGRATCHLENFDVWVQERMQLDPASGRWLPK